MIRHAMVAGVPITYWKKNPTKPKVMSKEAFFLGMGLISFLFTWALWVA